MNIAKIAIFVVFLPCIFSHMPTVYEFCSHVVANGDGGPPTTCDASQCRGRPGKIGPVGPRGIPGLKGRKGEQGTSEALEDKVKDLKDSVDLLRSALLQNQNLGETICYLGMKNREIPDSAITASSMHPPTNYHHTSHGRLDYSGSGSAAWCSWHNRVGEWIQVDLGEPKPVAGIITQGRSDAGQWIRSYKVSCGTTENLTTIRENGVEKVFNGNSDRDTKVFNKFPQPMTCRYIRVYPQTWNSHISMRLEFIHGACYDFY